MSFNAFSDGGFGAASVASTITPDVHPFLGSMKSGLRTRFDKSLFVSVLFKLVIELPWLVMFPSAAVTRFERLFSALASALFVSELLMLVMLLFKDVIELL